MKRIICFVLVMLVIIGCLTACNFTTNLSGAIAGAAEATPEVEKMMAALADDRSSDAKALLHPRVAETSDDAIAQLSAYLAGRKASDIQLTNINVNTSTGTGGKTRQEQGAYRVTLTDGAAIFLNVVYLSDSQGTGFVSFQIVLGVV